MIRTGPWDVATLGEEQGVKPGTYIVDSRMEPLALVIDDYAENMLAAGPKLLAALAAVHPRNAARTDCNERKCGRCSTCRADAAIADAESGQ